MSGIGFRKGEDYRKGEMPMISVITPSFRCAPFIRECIESVLAQNYPNFEHIIIDGASKDGTLEILKEYPHLKWISEPDGGEAEALNKALPMIGGDIIGWLNADDYYLEGVFKTVAREMDPLEGRHLVYGKTNIIDENGFFVGVRVPIVPVTLPSLVRWFCHLHIYQPSMFFSKALVDDVGPFREDLLFSIDYDYWLRISSKGYKFLFIDQVFANARLIRSTGKSISPSSLKEKDWLKVSLPYVRCLPFWDQGHFWKDYVHYHWGPNRIRQMRERMRFRTRIKQSIRSIRRKITPAYYD
jgi:glycosyltransferase involved in cell wall biosynthesis